MNPNNESPLKNSTDKINLSTANKGHLKKKEKRVYPLPTKQWLVYILIYFKKKIGVKSTSMERALTALQNSKKDETHTRHRQTVCGKLE